MMYPKVKAQFKVVRNHATTIIHYLPLLHVFRFQASGVKVECEFILHVHHFTCPFSIRVWDPEHVLGIVCPAHSWGAIGLRQRHPVKDPFAGLLLSRQTPIDDLIIKYVS